MLRTRKTEAGPAKPACPAHAASDAGEKTTGDRAGCGPRPQRALPWALGRHASVPRSGARRTVLPDPPLQEGSAVCTQTQLAEADPPAQDIGLGWSAGEVEGGRSGGGGGPAGGAGQGPELLQHLEAPEAPRPGEDPKGHFWVCLDPVSSQA